ncbi:hybrid sensor histidine kinase/response regulator transcription factor [Mariniflexile sp. AS56]|uniref:hybrid sensor histidine kinase/response regulator transcription factor n=1 Tax=Mariniflexile sp. AS56 TaxID=3063957 RepID=UPI0026F0DCBD|nr:hybrid sensor histidine kinase/response regulator transcription factor [Mariniflexile sp. AS56]MDO7173766.1 two-component regulator propeller domain-containing protein [Mariniflexile sp. AS56]
MNLKWYNLIVFCFVIFSSSAQLNNLKFENIDASDGLSSSTCLDIFQDVDGYLWFGTIDGLNKYNGYNIDVFRPNSISSISNVRINSIIGDKYGNLWIGTNGGLDFLNKKTNQFSRVNIFKKSSTSSHKGIVVNKLLYDNATNTIWVGTNSGVAKIVLQGKFVDLENLKTSYYVNNRLDNSIDNNNVNVILKDGHSDIWISTNGPYLNKYNRSKDNFERVLINNKNDYELNHISKRVYIDRKGNFWIGNDLSNLVLWNKKANTFSHVAVVDKQTPINDIFQDKEGTIWVSTDGFGLYLFNKNFKVLKHIVNNPSDPFSLPNNLPSKIFQDTDGIFWIGSYNKGVSKLNTSKNSFGHYYYQPNNPNGLNGEIIQSVLEDSKQRIWLGVYDNGLSLFDENKQLFKPFVNNPKVNNSLSSNKILYVFKSKDEFIWICTFDGGLNRFNPETNQFKRFLHDERDTTTIAQNSVWTGVEDSSNRIWLGLKTEGLSLYNPNTGKFHNYKNQFNNKNNLASNFVFSLFEDSKNRLFIGTTQGLNVVDLNTLKEFIPKDIHFKEVEATGIKGLRINYITEDSLGNIWLGADNGLYKLDASLNLVKTYTTQDGLPNNLVLGLKEDNDKNFWITTKSGMSLLDPDTHHFKNFNIIDGLQGAEYQSKSIEKTKDGRIIAGGLNGFNIFNPRNIASDSIILLTPKISSFRLNNRKIESGDSINGRVLLDKAISEIQNITLKYDENNISFEFEAIFLSNPNQVKYIYKLQGVDEHFVNAGFNRSVNYSNLQPGDYVFEVKASVDEEWNKQNSSTINIKILPPFWKRWWAYLGYIVIGSVLVWLFMNLYTEKIEEAQKHKLDLMKLEFFINVSHEFRTPLTLILNPLDKILGNFKDSEIVNSSALTAQRSARRLLHLVNQLLDYRKMDAGMAPLQLERGDIVNFSEAIFMLFKDLADRKEINYKFISTSYKIDCVFDFDKVEKIITNLISNAIKFTNSGGEITISVSKVKAHTANTPKVLNFKKNKLNDYVEIVVKDTGRGLNKEQLENVFSRFYNLDATKSGTGVGLNFTKGLVEMHKGEILVKSKHKKGSEFTVKIPLNIKGEIVHVENEKNEFLINSMKSVEYDMLVSNEELLIESKKSNSSGPKEYTVLIVEDNRELRVHLKDDLDDDYNIIEAENGEKGLKKALKYFPDIIISDVMMPKLDGFEMCKSLKTKLETCHIPIILLTARSREEDLISGYEHGADAYLPKPFKIGVLRSRIKNLLDSKERLREKFSKLGAILPSSELTTNAMDEAFLEKVTQIIFDNISDEDFQLGDLLKEVGVGRSHFYRKIKTLTGQNPSNFIRTIRLKYASELLLKSSFSIKEISNMSGFNSTTYFGKTFKELYNLTPSEYIENHKES